MLTIFYAGNFDAPTSSFGQNNGPNNFYAIYNRNDTKEGFVFLNHDAEHSLFVNEAWPGIGINENRVNIGTRTDENRMEVSSFSAFHPQWLHFKLSENEEYRLRFADRAAMYLTGNGPLTPDRCLTRFNERVSEIETAIIAESARWGDAMSGNSYTKDDNWLPEINGVRTGFFPVRTDIVIDQLLQEGLYTSLEPPEIIISGATVYDKDYSISSNTQISIENPNSAGSVYFTFDGSDPRLIGGDLSSVAIMGDDPEEMLIPASTIINARVYHNGNWSALRHINFFSENDDLSALKVTELHYHPVDYIVGTDTVSGKSFEFIEFKNTGESALNLSGLVLDSAVYYEFPQNTILAPNKFYVIASKPSWFYFRYGKTASGNFQGNLSNSGEEVLLNDSEGNELIRFIYDDHDPWPEEADGDGFSLVAIELDPTGDPASPYYWRGSYRIHGSPFGDDNLITGLEPGEQENNSNGHVLVYPNPTNGEIRIKSVCGDGGPVSIVLYSVNGLRLLDEESEAETSIHLERLNLEAGIYILQVELEDRLITKKIIYHP
jgi:hypothetical protein